jgi:hypothetical protein
MLPAHSLATTSAGNTPGRLHHFELVKMHAWMGGSCACHLRRRLHIGTWLTLRTEAAGFKTKGGQDKAFFFAFYGFGFSGQ